MKIIIFALLNIYVYSQVNNIIPLECNTSADEFGACVIHNGRKILYTSSKNNKQKIFWTEKIANTWSLGNETSEDLNKGEQIGFPTSTLDGNFIIFSAYKHHVKSVGRTDLYSAKLTNGEWTEITNLGNVINSEYWDSQPCLSQDGKILFFVSNRPGGFGGTDIYYSNNIDGEWTKPKNAGSKINSKYDEMTPFIAIDNKTFTFSSNRPNGIGGFDIYYSNFLNNDFEFPKLLEKPYNSEFDDYSYILLPKSSAAILTSNRPLSSGKLDLYQINGNPIRQEDYELIIGSILDKNTLESLQAEITILDINLPENKRIIQSDYKDGNFYASFQLGKTYLITASKKGYLFQSIIYQTNSESDGKEKSINFELSPIEKGVNRLVVFFEENTANLLGDSYFDLQNVLNLLKDNSNLKIRINAHTYVTGGAEINDALSQKRATSIKEYLVNNNIDSDRISIKGYGKSKPLRNDSSEEAIILNNRIEMQIIEN